MNVFANGGMSGSFVLHQDVLVTNWTPKRSNSATALDPTRAAVFSRAFCYRRFPCDPIMGAQQAFYQHHALQ
jgi:hypothetical protein